MNAVGQETRFVSFDCETTGLDPDRDRMVSIGAIAISRGQILLDDLFEALVRVPEATPSTLVHGITAAEAAAGDDECNVIRDFIDFAGDAVLVGHHVGFDCKIVARAAARHGFEIPHWRALDTMRLAIALDERGLLAEPAGEGFDLDRLCGRFGIELHDRHTAPGDAFLVAQVFMRLWRIADASGLDAGEFFEAQPEGPG